METGQKQVEGIFEVVAHGNYPVDGDRIFSTMGVVKEIREGNLHFSSPALDVHDKDIKGVYLDIDTPHGKGSIELPRNLALTDRVAIIGNEVRYTRREWSFLEGGAGYLKSNTYRLEIVTGNLSGQKIEDEITI
ncbi:MAG: hypothetical protein V1725_06575 [archaeon]